MMKVLLFVLLTFVPSAAFALGRLTYALNEGWMAICYPEDTVRYGRSIVRENVTLPHNFDDYFGSRQLRHGNMHGDLQYDIAFTVPEYIFRDEEEVLEGKSFGLRFDGVGSYLTVILNGDTVCSHRPAGRVVTNLEIDTERQKLYVGGQNKLRVICHHPSHITDLPWVCGGCSSEWGFSEGSQPMGLFRGVYFEVYEHLHLQPFGVHVWSNEACDTLYVETEIENESEHGRHKVRLETSLWPMYGKERGEALASQEVVLNLKRGEQQSVLQKIPVGQQVKRWSPDAPNLYKVKTRLMDNTASGGKRSVYDRAETEFGFRTIEWGRQFRVNGEAVFLNGICEYEHAFGHSHALTASEIDHRTLTLKDLGYNAFRDAHQPHNLRYVRNFNRLGIACWCQFSAHIWYDTPAFRNNFKSLLRQWVKERRNNPSVVLWGLQNESVLPEDFAAECAAIIREMDPTCRPMTSDNAGRLPCEAPSPGRLITTCNGGSGTDWNVVQNWSGTYGGNPDHYADELKQDNQLLNGEYGAWRTLGLHDLTLSRADSMTRATGSGRANLRTEEHFSQLLKSKTEQAWSVRDSVCGQFLWLMYSHDNPGRCQPDEGLRLIDKVGPYNSKGLFSPWGQPTDFAKALMGDTVCVEYETGSMSGNLIKGIPGMKYIYRYNCGGDSLTDSQGQLWMGDDTRFSTSWSQRPEFALDSLNPVLASQGVSDKPVAVAYPNRKPELFTETDQPLVSTYRWGRQDLKFRFPVDSIAPYTVEIFTFEPFVDRQGSRVFDIAVNGEVYARNFDIFQICKGKQLLVRTTLRVGKPKTDYLEISFPHIEAGQAVVSAIAISTIAEMGEDLVSPALSDSVGYPYSEGLTWAALDTMICPLTDKKMLPDWETEKIQLGEYRPDVRTDGSVQFKFATGLAREWVMRCRYKNLSGRPVASEWQLLSDADGRVIAQGSLGFPPTPPKFKLVSTTTQGMVNAGSYTLVIRPHETLEFDKLTIE